jgi:hypothetical protein
MFCWPCIIVYQYNETNVKHFSIYWDSKASTCFEHYLLILRRRSTNGIWYIACVYCQLGVTRLKWLLVHPQEAVKLQSCHSQLTIYARNIPNAVCEASPEDKQVVLETCRGLWFSIKWMKSASRWFHYTDILWCTVNKTLSFPEWSSCSRLW